MAETHSAVVTFLGDRAYKVKKPVQFDFLDFRTRPARRQAIERELELNRRLAPDVYLGIVEVGEASSSAGPEEPVSPGEPVLVMRRMPAERRLERLVGEGDPRAATALDELAVQLAAFHAGARRGPDVDAACTAEAWGRLWQGNFAEMRPFVGSVFDAEALARAEELSARWLAGRGPLLAHRIARGAVCDGHGDLQAADVFCLDDGPRALDGIEFDERLRWADVAADVAFLSMDLERLGASALGERFRRAYEQAAGRVIPDGLWHHYVAYRAQVRAKVAALRSGQRGASNPSASPAEPADVVEARGLLALCLRHLHAARVRLVLVGGLPGTGKSTLATELARALGADLLRSDLIRKEGLPSAPAGAAPGEAGEPGDLDRGLYDPARSDAVYRTLLARAGDRVSMGSSVVVDASWHRAATREAARALAAASACELVEVRCEVDPEVAAERLRRRSRAGTDPSDATPRIASAMAARADAWPEAATVVTDRPAPALAAALVASLDQAG